MSALQKIMRFIWQCALPILMAIFMVALPGAAFAGPNTSLPFTDGFETYTNSTPLVDGTNGWYGDSSSIIVQTNTVRTGTNAAIIPVDCTLSNRFESIAPTNVWIQMDIRPILYEGTNYPVVDTNQAGMFYINTNGHFVVHNGPTTNATDSTNWVTLTNSPMGTNGTNWVTIGVYENFSTKTWDLYTNSTLLTNNIGFVNTNLTNFVGFDVYNGMETSYLDNVYVRTYVQATKLTIQTQPSASTAAGAAFAPQPVVRIEDQYGNLVTTGSAATQNVTVALTVGSGTLGGTTNMNAVAGVADFAGKGLNIDQVGADKVLTFSATGLSNAVSDAFTITAAAATKAVFTTQPSASTVAGVAFAQQPVVTIWDAFSNTVTTATSNVVLTLSTGTGTLGGTVSMAAVAGVADFAGKGLNIDKAGTNKVLTATVTGLTTDTTTPAFAITAAAAAKSVFTTQPSASTVAGVAFAQQPVVTIWDAFSNTVTTATSNVVLTLSTGTGTLGGTVSMAAVAGVADFAGKGLNIDKVGTNKVLTATVSGLTTGTTTPAFAITPATLASFTVAEITDPVVAGTTTSPKVTALDTLGNVKTNYMGTITFSSDDGVATLPANYTFLADDNGVHTFTNLLTLRTAGEKYVRVADGVSTGQQSNIMVTYAAASKVNVETAANGSGTIVPLQDLVSGSNLTVYAITRDAYTNFVANVAADSWALINITGGVVDGDLVAGGDMKSAVFTGAMNGTAQIQATSGSLAKNVSGVITVIGGNPTLSASKGLRREVKVTWSVLPGATSYELWKNTVNESSSANLLASGSATLYRDMAVIPGSNYYYWVKALCPSGDSGFGTSSVGWCGAAKWDFNGDGRAEAWYYHEASGRWYVMMTTNMLSTIELGGVSWDAVPADYDGDGKVDLAVYNRGDPSTGSGLGGTWQFRLSGSGYELFTASDFGGAGYAAAVGDYDGDGKADPAIYAEASGTWQIAMSGNGYHVEVASGFGEPGYRAVPTDYDGDGKTDPAVYEQASGNWSMALSGNGYNVSNVLQFGQSGFAPVPGEYEGLGYAQIAVYHEASGNWYIRTGPGPGEYTRVYFGMPGYLPMPADYDGDKYEDEGVFYRNRYDATWYLLRSTEGFKMISGRDSRP